MGTTAYAMYYLLALSVWYVVTPYILSKLKLERLLVGSVIVTLLFGVLPYTHLFNFSRIVCFYPFFIAGVWLKEHYNEQLYNINRSKRILAIGSFSALCGIYLVANVLHPGIVYGTGFVSGFGLSISGMLIRIFTIMMCMAMCLSLIIAVPNKEYWFTKYGSRTMNVYLLHMLIVFPICWYFTAPIHDTWYGIAINAIGVPLLCTTLFSERIDNLMRSLLCQ